MKTIDFAALAAPFKPSELEWRIGSSGVGGDGRVWAQILCYLTSRAVQDRLDAVCSPENWKNEIRHFDLPGRDGGGCRPNAGVVQGIAIRIDGEWIAKFDGAENTDVESVKGGISDAEKRAAVQWGIGRYLYGLGTTWADTSLKQEAGWERAKTKKEGTVFWWAPPADVMHFLANAYAGAGKTTVGTEPEPEAPVAPRPPAPKKEPPPGHRIAEAVHKLAHEFGEGWPPADFLTEACAPHPDGEKQVWSQSDYEVACKWINHADVDRVLDALRKFLVAERKRRREEERKRAEDPAYAMN